MGRSLCDVESRLDMASGMSFPFGVLLFLSIAVPAFGQDPAPDAAAAAPAVARHVDYGVRFGPSFTTLTSVETFDDTVVAAAAEPTMNFGGFVTIELSGPLSFQAEALFAAKGNRVYGKDARPVITGTGTRPPQADQVILIRYLEFPLLLRASNRTGAASSVYLIAGPALAIRRNAVIREVADSGRLEEITDEVTSGAMSLVFGGGLQHQRWLVDARLTRGLGNVAVAEQPAPVKTNAFAVLMGVRF
jgi:hypothetical protein